MEQLQVLNAGGCGVSVLSGLQAGPDGKYTMIEGCRYTTKTFREAVKAGHLRLWPSYPNTPPGSCVIWADTKNSNGEQIYKTLLKDGEIVDKIECGVNATHGPAHICVYFWYCAPASKALHPKAKITRIELEQEQKSTGTSIEIGTQAKEQLAKTGLRPRVHKLRGASRTRVPEAGAGGVPKRFRFGWSGPKWPVR